MPSAAARRGNGVAASLFSVFAMLASAQCGPDEPCDTHHDGGAPDAAADLSVPAKPLPCDVAKVMQTRCLACHSNPPKQGAPMPLVTYQDLTSMSQFYPMKTVAQRAVDRMSDNTGPMPPGPAKSVPDPEIMVVESWITAGMPEGTTGMCK